MRNCANGGRNQRNRYFVIVSEDRDKITLKNLQGKNNPVIDGDETLTFETQNPDTSARGSKPSRNHQKEPSRNVALVVSKIDELSGKKYSPTAIETTRRLAAILKTHSVDECLKVVHDRWRRWGNDVKMIEHFNPITLFRTENFSKYLIEADSPTGMDSSDHIIDELYAHGK